MSDIVVGAASRFAARTNRHGFLARSGKVVLGVVGGTALLSASATTAWAGSESTESCDCGPLCDSTCVCNTGGIIHARNCYDCGTRTCAGHDPVCCCTGIICYPQPGEEPHRKTSVA